MSFPTLPELQLPQSWTVSDHQASRTRTEILGAPAGTSPLTIIIERCGAGRLAEAYPISTHDIEIRVASPSEPGVLTSVLQELATDIQLSDPECRRVVFAAPVGDLSTIAAAEQAGFRYVLDVDIVDGPVSLLVIEPSWVTQVDMDLDRVPQT